MDPLAQQCSQIDLSWLTSSKDPNGDFPLIHQAPTGDSISVTERNKVPYRPISDGFAKDPRVSATDGSACGTRDEYGVFQGEGSVVAVMDSCDVRVSMVPMGSRHPPSHPSRHWRPPPRRPLPSSAP